jgi:sterol desaturase/sphingolipid hydroxylase (fatty acid hydroxylase superfamily)
MKTTTFCRLGLGLLAVIHYNYPAICDGFIADFYEICLNSAFFRHDSCEPIVAVLGFIVWILGWYFYDKSMGANGAIWSEPRRQDRNGFFSVLFTYLLPIMIFDALVPRRQLVLISTPPSFSRLIWEISAGIFLYDAGFYICHRMIHHPKYYKSLHAIHHRFLPTTARETFRLSLTEVWIDSAISILALNLLRAHPLSRCFYNVCITYLLVELHSDHEFDWMTHKVVGFGLMGGPKYHSKHHAIAHGNYSKFFTIWDRLFGTTLK